MMLMQVIFFQGRLQQADDRITADECVVVQRRRFPATSLAVWRIIPGLAAGCMPLAGLVVNRVQRLAAVTLGGGKAIDAAEQLEAVSPEARLTIGMLQLHGELAETAERQGARVQRFATGHPGTPIREVPAEATDIDRKSVV